LGGVGEDPSSWVVAGATLAVVALLRYHLKLWIGVSDESAADLPA
jgi:hypothetical protein